MDQLTGSSISQIIPDYTHRFLLRPYEGFATQYQGQGGTIPILFSEVADPSHSLGGNPSDVLALRGEEGYDPNLVRGLKVPLGARCLLWLPSLTIGDRGTERYRWVLIWRLRNVRDYRLTDDERMPYHNPKGVPGVNDGNDPTDPERVVIAAAYETIWYSPSEPGAVDAHVVRSGRAVDLSYAAVDMQAPFLPSGARGAIQQGILNPAVFADALLPLWGTYETVCKGDEVLLGLFRATSTWDFTSATEDQFISTLFQSSGAPIFPDMGVYVFVGSGPSSTDGPTA
jgi:hypothetical protein